MVCQEFRFNYVDSFSIIGSIFRILGFGDNMMVKKRNLFGSLKLKRSSQEMKDEAREGWDM